MVRIVVKTISVRNVARTRAPVWQRAALHYAELFLNSAVVECIVDGNSSSTNRQTEVSEQYFVRVDVEEEWPFLVSGMSPYYER